MLYLLDANVLIRAHGDYYPLDRVPQFWTWLTDLATRNKVKIPFEIIDEIANGDDLLSNWASSHEIQEAFVLQEEVDGKIFNRVLNQYATNLNDNEIEEIGRDPFLIAYAAKDASRTVVTKEISKPSKQRANRTIPDVCGGLSVECITDFELYKRLDFRT